MNSIVQGIEIRREGPVWHWIVRARGLSMTGVDGLLVDAVCDAVEAFGQLRRQEAMG